MRRGFAVLARTRSRGRVDLATISISDAREHFPAAMETALTEAVIVERRGRPVGVLVSPERYEQLTSYRIELRPSAVRALRELDLVAHRRVQGAIALLAQDPRPPGAQALKGRPALRVRVGDYRITYTVRDDVLVVVVVRLGHRRDVYEK